MRITLIHGAAMNALLVGADRLGKIPDVLSAFGIAVAGHVSGRDSKHQRQSPSLPSRVDLVILFTDFLGHNVMRGFRQAAERQGVGVVCCRRSTCALREALADRLHAPSCVTCPTHCPQKRN